MTRSGSRPDYLPILLFFFSCSGAHRDLHSFPTRRSSDLKLPQPDARHGASARRPGERRRAAGRGAARGGPMTRSEEHTSELQSRENLVCRLLLEKKKKKNKI